MNPLSIRSRTKALLWLAGLAVAFVGLWTLLGQPQDRSRSNDLGGDTAARFPTEERVHRYRLRERGSQGAHIPGDSVRPRPRDVGGLRLTRSSRLLGTSSDL